MKKYIIRGFHRCIICNMAQHPWGRTIEIFGIESPTNGRSCEEHVVCGSVLQDDVVVRLRKVQVVIEDKEETAIAAFWVSDGVDRCRVGYLPKFHVKHWKELIQFPPEMDENWVRYGLAKLGQISRLPNWQKIVVLCVHNTTSALNS